MLVDAITLIGCLHVGQSTSFRDLALNSRLWTRCAIYPIDHVSSIGLLSPGHVRAVDETLVRSKVEGTRITHK